MSYKNVCELLILLKEQQPINKKHIKQLAQSICTLSRGGYIVMLGLYPLEMMLLYEENEYAVRYIQLLKEYDNGLLKKDIKHVEDLKSAFKVNNKILRGLDELIVVIRKKYEKNL